MSTTLDQIEQIRRDFDRAVELVRSYHYGRKIMQTAVAIVSGGMDSITLLHRLNDDNVEVHVLSFDYGQRHKKELEFAKYHTDQFGFRHDIIDLSGITHLISNSALTSPPRERIHRRATFGPQGMIGQEEVTVTPHIEVPDGHYAEESMKLTVVPNRNMMMLSIAAAVAVNDSYDAVTTGVHAGDHFIYPDCRPEFINAANQTILLGNAGFGSISDTVYDKLEDGYYKDNPFPQFVYAPFLNKTKTQIAEIGNQLGVDWTTTWSCYKGGDKHCGTCGTCTERKEALRDADNGDDPTEYLA